MKSIKKLYPVMICIACIAALIIVIFPLLLIAKYNYPSADDWSFGVYGYKALQNGQGLPGVLRSAFEMTKYNYLHWEGRFSSTFLGALQPGIWGEECYGIVAWLMLGGIIFSAFFLCGSLLKNVIKSRHMWYVIPIMVPTLVLQIMYSPSPAESFYWYTGSMNYTFVYGLSLVFIALFMKLSLVKLPKWRYGVGAMIACFLAILIGGNNFATSLSGFLALVMLSAVFLWRKPEAFRRTWFLTLFMGISLGMCIFSPGSAARINGNFNGETGDALQAIVMSLVRSFTNIYSWTNMKVILMLLFILPFVWMVVKEADYHFPFPGLFTLTTFGLYASQITATMYVDGTTGGGRMAAILFYSYHLWMVGNFCYWIGWLCRRQNKIRTYLAKALEICENYILIYCVIIGGILAGMIYVMDLHDLSSYKAYRNWRQGWAQQYAAEWQARLEILHDDSIDEVVFEPLSVWPEMLMYTDLQDENGYIWVNIACEEYYDKKSVKVKMAESGQ